MSSDPPSPAGSSQYTVDVRMYRALEDAPAGGEERYAGLLGDCFLIRLHDTEQDKRSTILIDCGLLLGSPDAHARMDRIARDIVAACGGDLDAGVPGTLDLLIVTHRHWDHISGFAQAGDILLDRARLEIGQLWMSWAEGPDGEAKEIQAGFDAGTAAFAAIAAHLTSNASRFGADAASRALNGLDAFMGLAAAEGKLTSGQIMDKIRQGVANKAFLEPGTVRRTPAAHGAPSLRAFVLGPPRDKKFLFKDDPSKGDAKETYLDAPAVDVARLLGFAEADEADPLRDSPFAPGYCGILCDTVEAGTPDPCLSPANARAFEWLRQRYFGAEDDPFLERRRIYDEWLGIFSPLAAKLDRHINNTSLALAFELPDGSVMLFPADAQVGNWLSWHKHDYVDENGRTLKAADLLRQTRFYKVGHHGSHNATLEDQGLELMTRDDLVAMIPTDEALGKDQGRHGWRMPDPVVDAPLRVRTANRILRNDGRYSPEARRANPGQTPNEAFFDRLTETRLFLEYRVYDPEADAA